MAYMAEMWTDAPSNVWEFVVWSIPSHSCELLGVIPIALALVNLA